jgi:hypothetical protein
MWLPVSDVHLPFYAVVVIEYPRILAMKRERSNQVWTTMSCLAAVYATSLYGEFRRQDDPDAPGVMIDAKPARSGRHGGKWAVVLASALQTGKTQMPMQARIGSKESHCRQADEAAL